MFGQPNVSHFLVFTNTSGAWDGIIVLSIDTSRWTFVLFSEVTAGVGLDSVKLVAKPLMAESHLSGLEGLLSPIVGAYANGVGHGRDKDFPIADVSSSCVLADDVDGLLGMFVVNYHL